MRFLSNTSWLILLLILTFISCKTGRNSVMFTEDLDSFVLTNTTRILYENSYNRHNQLLSFKVYKSENDTISKGNLTHEGFNFYDDRGKLVRSEVYGVDSASNLNSFLLTELFSDSLDQYIKFHNYPNDTAVYSYRKKNTKGLVVEEYRKKWKDSNLLSEVLTRNEYNKRGRLVHQTLNNLLDGSIEITEHRFIQKKDTLIETIYNAFGIEKNSSKTIKKRGGETFVSSSTDMYYKSRYQTLFLFRSADFRYVNESFLDSFGNINKQIIKVYESKDKSYVLDFSR